MQWKNSAVKKKEQTTDTCNDVDQAPRNLSVLNKRSHTPATHESI